MAKEGFAIRCPHCQRWSYWNEHPREKVLDSVEELNQILKDLNNADLPSKQKDFSHPKLLRCKSSPFYCPASFEAFVCRGDEDPHKYSNIVESWSFKRHFRLYKADTHNRWDNANEDKYCGILFNTQQISRRRYIELESLMDRELVSRLIAGMCVEIDLPLTFFAANIFELDGENRNAQRYWMPIEGYSQKQKLVPPRFSLFCETCRNISMKKLIEEFEGKNYNVNNCPIEFSSNNGKCMGKKAACVQEPKDWNHCPAFVEERKDKCPCYNSDVTLIDAVEDEWRNGTVPKEGVWRRCHAGFYDVAFPIEVHGHLVGIAMTGQLFFEPNEIKHADDFIKSKKVGEVEHRPWYTLTGKAEELEKARQILVGFELHNRDKGKSIFLVDKTQAKQKIERLLPPNLERFEKSAESHYRDFRAKSEFSFRQELLGFIENHKMESDFFNKYVSNVLKRMQEFWAFKGAYLLHYSYGSKKVSTIATSILGKTDAFGFPGREGTKLEIEQKEMHSCPYLHLKGKEPPFGSRLRKFTPVIEKIVDSFELKILNESFEFMVVVPTYQEVYVFVFAVRDKGVVESLEPLEPDNVSALCQDAIFETCNEVIHKFQDVQELSGRRDLVRVKHLQELKSKIQEDINKISVSKDVFIEELLHDDKLSDRLRNTVLQIKNRDSNIVPIIEKRFKEELEKLKQNT